MQANPTMIRIGNNAKKDTTEIKSEKYAFLIHFTHH